MNPPNELQGMTAVAELLNQEYGDRLGITCDRRRISDWRHGKLIPKGMAPFPAPGSDNKYNLPPIRAWIENFIAGRARDGGPMAAVDESKAEATARRERAKADREERLNQREAGTLIERAVAENDAIGIVQRLHNACTLQDEQEVPVFCITELKQLGVDREIVSVFAAKLIEKMRDITTRRVAMFQNSTEEFLKGQA